MEFFVIVENIEIAPNSDDGMVICETEGYFTDANKAEVRVNQLCKLYCDTKRALKQEVIEEDETRFGFIPLGRAATEVMAEVDKVDQRNARTDEMQDEVDERAQEEN